MSTPYEEEFPVEHRELGSGGMWITEGRPFIHFGTQPGEFVWAEDVPSRWQRIKGWFRR